MSEYDFKKLSKTEMELKEELDELKKIQNKIKERVKELTGERKLKGDEIVGWLGELFCSTLVSGEITIEDNLEYDVITESRRISVKTRKGNNPGWNKTSNISSKEINESSPTHLMFVQLDEDFSVKRIWMYDWDKNLVERFKPVNVKKNKKSESTEGNYFDSESTNKKVEENDAGIYYFRVDEKKDKEKLIYSKKYCEIK